MSTHSEQQDIRHTTPNAKRQSTPLVERRYVFAFLLVGALFPLWGFANDVTNPMVKVFEDVFQITTGQASLVQFAFYMGYGVMAVPAALFIRIFSFKAGILLGLMLYALGAFLFVPASLYAEFNLFLMALWILTLGLALLETTANPFILAMGDKETAARRLNLAQAFNPLGSLLGMVVAQAFVLKKLEVGAFRDQVRLSEPALATAPPATADAIIDERLQSFIAEQPTEWAAMQMADLATVRGPYLLIGIVVVLLAIAVAFAKLPHTVSDKSQTDVRHLRNSFRRLLGNTAYREGVISQGFYVGAQIMCWTFIIHYGVTVVGLSAAEAQSYNIVAMVLFLISRFVSTAVLSSVPAPAFLSFMAIGAACCTMGAIVFDGMMGLYALIAVSGFMSMMFPTIYAIALNNTGDDASLGSAGLVMAIAGGAILTQAQGLLIDTGPFIPGTTDVQSSFVLPVVCFAVIAVYGWRRWSSPHQ
ncbi:MAG: L-fucose:H+ symporter permease [Pseudomonadota bacterium]